MKRIVFIVLLTAFAVNLSAQKTVRQSIRKGNKAFKEQRYSAAETDYAKAMEENAASKEASFNLANTYYKQNRHDEAINEYKYYLTLENESPKNMSAAWSNIGNTFLKKKASEKSQMQAQQGGQPQKQQADNLQMSMEAYKNALRLNPTDDATRENLAIVQKMIKDQEGDGGGDDDKNQDKDEKEDKKEENKEDKQDKDEDKQDKQDQQKEDQMSQENIQQILEAIEQDERETQNRVNQLKADERKKQNARNRQQDKDW